MKVSDVISKYYNYLYKYLTLDKVIAQSKTEEDILHDLFITAMTKYGDEDVDENECLEYLKRNLYYKKLFQYKKKTNEILIYTDDLSQFDELNNIDI